MEFEWDEDKRLSNIEKHGLDFHRIRQLFDGRPVQTIQSSYLFEDRWISTGEVDGKLCTVIWTAREESIRIISARRARNAEKRAYRQIYG